MKKNLIIFTLLLTGLFAFTSCEKEKEEVDILLGKWDYVKETYTKRIDGALIKNESYPYNPGEYYVEYSGNKFAFWEDNGTDPDGNGTFTKVNNVLTLNFSDGDIEIYELRFTDSNNVVAYAEERYTLNGKNYIETEEYTLKRR